MLDTREDLELSCPLCVREKLTQWYYNSPNNPKWGFAVVFDCKTCKVPLVVHRVHVDRFTNEERMSVVALVQKLFGSDAVKYIDWTMRNARDHAHCHVRLPKGFARGGVS